MSENEIKNAVAKFLANINHTARHEIEKAIRRGLAAGSVNRAQDLAAAVTLSSDKVGLDITIHGRIEL